MKLYCVKLFFVSFLALSPVLIFSQTVLNADGPGNTYELINSVLAPGATAVETPDQFDPAFGRHIAEVWDADLNQYVFEFYLHTSVPNELQDEATGDTDRQRCEIKTYASSPANLIGTVGESIIYKWRFKVPTGFKPSPSFTHIHQIKAVGGDDGNPIFVLTARYYSTGNKLELTNYDNDNISKKLTSANLSLFENTWVEATEKILVDNLHGTYSMSIARVSDGAVLLSYTNNNIGTIRTTNNFIRPKWGIYRSLLNVSYLRDESLRFNSFSIQEVPSTAVQTPTTNPNFQVSIDKNTDKGKVEYYLSNNEAFSINIYNLNGQLAKNIITEKNQKQGNYSYSFDTSNLINGVYIVRFLTAKSEITKKIIL